VSRLALCVAGLMLCVPLAWGANPSAVPLLTEHRVALVIGNDNYQNVTKLENARADARAIANSLRAAGFDVDLRIDIAEKAMKEAVRIFKSKVGGGDVAVFYYSGHGVQLGAANYLLPVDVRGESEDQLKDDALPLQRVLDDLQDQKAKFSLAIIDACRDNPFKGAGQRALGGRGLAPPTAANGQMVLFSAGSGQRALDKTGPGDRSENGVFTRVLLEEMDKPDVPVDRVLKNVRQRVVQIAKSVDHDQVPAIYDQVVGDFFFKVSPPGANAAVSPRADQVAPVTAAPVNPQPPVPGRAAGAKGKPEDPDTAMWHAVETNGTVDDLASYMQQFPRGKFLALAKLRQQKLRQDAIDAANAADEAAWQAADSGANVTAYQNYLANYPKGRYAGTAQAKLYRAKTDAQYREETAQWQQASTGSKAQVENYLSRYPNGQYVAQANKRLAEFQQEEASAPPPKKVYDAPTRTTDQPADASDLFHRLRLNLSK